MGRMLGAFADDNDLDRPDLNKCPDCGCYFKQDACPLCGKVCPEEMRAGNRAPVKVKKKKRSHSNGRVTFIEWYHSWWFILVMLVFVPYVGIILLLTSPHSKTLKWGIATIAILYALLFTFGLGSTIRNYFTNAFDPPVNDKLTQDQYIAGCETVSAEEFYRSSEDYTDRYLTFTVVLTEKFIDEEAYYDQGINETYYICQDVEGGAFEILLRDCILENAKNYMPGDVITVYGEGAGQQTVYDMNGNTHTAPCLNVAYAVLVQE